MANIKGRLDALDRLLSPKDKGYRFVVPLEGETEQQCRARMGKEAVGVIVLTPEDVEL